MSTSQKHSRFKLAQNAFFAMAGSAAVLAMGSKAKAGGTPVWFTGEAGVFTQTYNVDNTSKDQVQLPINATATPSIGVTNMGELEYGGGSTTASAGLGHTQSSTTAKIVIASGTGISQTSTNEGASPSSLEVLYNASWAIPAGGFGVPIAGNFSLPIGAKVGIDGSASVTIKIDWDYIRNGTEVGFREYNDTQTWTNYEAEGPLNVLTTITAPTVLFNPNQLISGDTLLISGDITFTASSDDPTLIEVPTANDFGALGVTSDQVGTSSLDVVPEPSSTLLLGVAGATYVMCGRRRNRAVRIA